MPDRKSQSLTAKQKKDGAIGCAAILVLFLFFIFLIFSIIGLFHSSKTVSAPIQQSQTANDQSSGNSDQDISSEDQSQETETQSPENSSEDTSSLQQANVDTSQDPDYLAMIPDFMEGCGVEDESEKQDLRRKLDDFTSQADYYLPTHGVKTNRKVMLAMVLLGEAHLAKQGINASCSDIIDTYNESLSKDPRSLFPDN